MKWELKQQWIKALLSGKYKQGKRNLCKGEGKQARYCCLGVLCEILAPETKSDSGGTMGVFEFDGETGVLSPRLLKKAGLKEETQQALIFMNDIGGLGFKKIAKFVDTYIMDTSI